MRKYYGLIESDLEHGIYNHYYKTLSYFMRFISFNKKQRDNWKVNHQHIYHDNYRKNFEGKYNNSIINGSYYIPISFIVHDIIPKEKTEDFIKKTIKLLKRQMSGKFMGSTQFDSDFLKLKEMIDIHSWDYDTWSRIGIIDFENDKFLRKYIDHISIKVRNFSLSYFAIELKVTLTDSIRNEMTEVINDNYISNKYYTRKFLSGKKISGARQKWTVLHYNNDHLKSELIDSQLIRVKWHLFHELSNYYDLILHKHGIMPPSVNIYITNIDYKNKEASNFFDSVGLDRFMGEFINDSSKLFFTTSRRSDKRGIYSDMILVVNDDKMEKQDMYYDIEFQIISEFEERYSQLLRYRVADNLGIHYASLYSKYRNIIKKLKIYKTTRSYILKQIYQFDVDFEIFERMYKEIDWKREENKVSKYFPGVIEYPFTKPRFVNINTIMYCESIFHKVRKIDDKKNLILLELERKSNLIKNKREYSLEKKNLFISVVMLIITLITLSILIYPDFGKTLANLLDGLIDLYR